MADWKSIIFYVLMLSVIVWFILKVTGILQSPSVIELYPWFAMAVGAGVAYGKITTTLKNINHKLAELKDIPQRLTHLETTCKLTHKRK